MAKEILIANSDKADQQELQRIFETTDYRLIFSESGEEALLRVKLFKPDLIIAASGLPEKNGLKLCEDIRADSESKHIPFILLSNIFGEISERDCKRVQADGVISKPLHEIEVLNLVQYLLEEKAVREKEKGISEKEMERRPLADIRRGNPGKGEDLQLDELEEDEIIELVDVVEEPEAKMSIDDFVHPEKTEPLGELAPFESWERLEEEVRPEERASLRKFKPPVTGFKLSPEEEDEVETEEMLFQLEKEISPKETSGKEVEFFEKIELEEILEKVEQLKPSIEKEWPPEKEWPLEREWAPVKETRPSEKAPPTSGEVEEKYSGFEGFETALKMGVKQEALEEEIQPFVGGELKAEAPKEAVIEETMVEELRLEELAEEEFPEELLEVVKEEEIGVVREPQEIRLEGEKAEPRRMWPEEIGVGESAPEQIRPTEIAPEEVWPEVRPKEETPEEIRVEQPETPRIFEEEIGVPPGRVDRRVEEIVTKGVREMMQEFLTKLLPEMTQNIIGLTLERIEKMVKEVVPDLAEKAIQEEIKRLQKGEKD